MHLGEVLNSKDDPTFPTPRSNWTVALDGGDDDLDQDMINEMDLDGPECVLDRLIDLSLGKIHRLQTAQRKDEHKRVLVVSTLHRLLLQKMESLQAELALEESTAMIEDTDEMSLGDVTPKQEAAIILNRILQEKIGCLGYNRTVKIWVEAPRNPGQNTTISMPQRGGRKVKQPGKDEFKMESNSAAPSEREPATL